MEPWRRVRQCAVRQPAFLAATEQYLAILDGRAPDRIVVAGGGKLVNLVVR